MSCNRRAATKDVVSLCNSSLMTSPIQASGVNRPVCIVCRATCSSLFSLLNPESFEVIRMTKVNCNSDDVSVLHRLPNLNVFVRKDLNLLAIRPKCRVEAVKQDCCLWSVDVFKRDIVTFVAETDEYFLKVGRVVCFQLQLPVMNAMQRKWLSHYGRYRAVVRGLADTISLDSKRLLNFLVTHEWFARVRGHETTLVFHVFLYR